MNTAALNSRQTAMHAWLAGLPADLALEIQTITPASSDASFRRYDRIQAGAQTLVIMDAPPPFEDCKPFVDVTKRLANAGLQVPKILAKDLTHGFLLLSDLGRQTYYDRVQTGISDAELQTRYRCAIDALVTLQKNADPTGLPTFDAPRLLQELQVFIEWYVTIHHQTELTANETEALANIFERLAQHTASEPAVLVHRDFHSPNLMCSADPSGAPGIIDYQDAVSGAISYDLASLVFDARTTWEEPQQLDWAIRYWERARQHSLPVPDDFAAFHQQYEWTSLQRNLRILGVFARLNYRDGKTHYLNHIPRVLGYTRQVAQRYRPFIPLLRLLDRLDGIERKAAYTF